MRIESEVLRKWIEERGLNGDPDLVKDELLELINSLEQQNVDNPSNTTAFWTSLGHHAELSYKGKHWTLRAFPGGYSAKCAETGVFQMAEAADLPSAMLAAEEFVRSQEDATPVVGVDSAEQDKLVEEATQQQESGTEGAV